MYRPVPPTTSGTCPLRNMACSIMCVCVCVCVCMRERESEREGERGGVEGEGFMPRWLELRDCSIRGH